MLLQELRSVTEYTKIDEPTLMAAAGVVGSGVPLTEASAANAFATKLATSSIITGMYNRENVSNALHNPALFWQLYALLSQVKELSSTDHLSLEPVREHIDLSIYFNKRASQMEALTQLFKPNPWPPYNGAAIANRAGSPAAQEMQVRVEPQVDNGEGVSVANRYSVSFWTDRSSHLSSSHPSFLVAVSGGKGAAGLVQSDHTASLVASVNQLTNHMTQVQDLFRRAMGARPVPKRREGLSVSEEVELRYCASNLTDNMAKKSGDLKKALGKRTVVPLSQLVVDLNEEAEDCRGEF
ncbi:hypothetical protein MTO96_024244 [Rhipicephalus appendiculatus]